LFLDPTGKGLQAWSYDAGADAWSQLPASPALQLGSDPWLSHPEYYSTIQTGDVDGDGRDDVVARGPYGIRTWFYNRRGTDGWERYLAGGYPAFNSQGAQNEQNAYAALNKAATPGLIPSGALRDLWTGENAPQSGDVTKVTNRLPGIAGCDTATGSPPQVTACTPPAGSTGFTATQWTAVVNDMLAESDAAGEVLAFFTDLKSMREDLFQQETAELPAIGGDLGLQAAAANTAQFNPQGYFAGALGIAASIVGLIPDIGPALSAAMWVGSEIASMIPQSSPTATASTFPSTYAGLQDKFATMVSESDKGLAVMSQEVRQDSSLLGLVSQLRESGPWATKNLDMIGLQSADNQGFAIWVYQTLMPTVYVRYSITNCSTQSIDGGTLKCAPPPAGSGTVGGGTPDFTALGTPLAENQFPCLELLQNPDWYCFFNAGVPPSTLANQIWGAVSATCSYVPGNALTQWTFGNCSAGVDVNSSVLANTWGFPTYSGSPIPPGAVPRQPTAASARSRSRSLIPLGRPRVGARPAARGRAQVTADLFVPRRLRLAGAKVRLDRLLFERRGRGELTRPRGGRSAARLTLRRAGPRRFTATTTGRRRARVTLRRTDRGRTRLTLAFGARAFRVPRACHALPAGVVPDTPPLQLTTRLVISDGRTRHRVLLRHELRCARDARGNVDRLVRVRHRSYPLRPGLAVSLHGPRRAQAGTSARYVARLRNRRGGRDRLRSSLWDVTLTSGTRTARFHEVPRGRSRRLVFSRRVPRSARGRFCVDIVATAPGARAVRVSDCARVRAAAAPAFTG
jgi:hypothetical protein